MDFKPLQRNPRIYIYMTEKHKLEPGNIKSQQLVKKHVTSMSCHPSPRYSHVTLFGRYPVLTAVN